MTSNHMGLSQSMMLTLVGAPLTASLCFNDCRDHSSDWSSRDGNISVVVDSINHLRSNGKIQMLAWGVFSANPNQNIDNNVIQSRLIKVFEAMAMKNEVFAIKVTPIGDSLNRVDISRKIVRSKKTKAQDE